MYIRTLGLFSSKVSGNTNLYELLSSYVCEGLLFLDLTENEDNSSSLPELILNQHGISIIQSSNTIIVNDFLPEVDGEINNTLFLHGKTFEIR